MTVGKPFTVTIEESDKDEIVAFRFTGHSVLAHKDMPLRQLMENLRGALKDARDP